MDAFGEGRRMLVGVLAGMLLHGCGRSGATGQPAGDGMPTQPAVTVKVFQFRPDPLEVPVGATVTWTNRDDIEHTATAGSPGSPSRTFDGELSGKGATFSYTFEEEGTYPYFCAIHESMRGEIRVS